MSRLRFPVELGPRRAIRFAVQDGEAVPPDHAPAWKEAFTAIDSDLHAIDHGGRLIRVGGWRQARTVQVSTPGLDEITSEGVCADPFHPLPSRLIDVRARGFARSFDASAPGLQNRPHRW